MQYKNAEPTQLSDGSWTLVYQVTDHEGNPVGGKSTFTGSSEREVMKKVIAAHQNAQLAVERLRKRQPIYKPGQEPQTVDKAIQQAAAAEKTMVEAREAYIFMQNHLPGSDHAYYPCQANSTILSNWLEQNDMEFVAENLEIAFDAVENSLAKTNKPATRETPEEVVPPTPALPWSHIRNINDLNAMPKEEYKKLLFSPKYSTDFKKHIAAIQGVN